MENNIQNSSPSTTRIEAFSDGVFAIVVTLLVLELAVPVLGHEATDEQAEKSLIALIPKFISWAMSFIVVAIFWVNHHQFMHSLKKADRKLLWHNMHLLFWISFIPFPTAFIGEYYTLKTAAFLFGCVLFMAALAFYLLSRYAHMKSDLHKDLPIEVRTFGMRKALIAPVFYSLSMVFAFINPTISIIIFFLVAIIFFIPLDFMDPEEMMKKRQHKLHHLKKKS